MGELEPSIEPGINPTSDAENQPIQNGEGVSAKPREGNQEEREQNESGLDVNFTEAKSFTDLYIMIDKINELEGSTKTYSKDDIKERIAKIKNGLASLGQLTRTGGLRNRVRELMNMEQLKKDQGIEQGVERPDVNFNSADTFGELYRLIDDAGGVEGSKQHYDPKTLILLIEKARENKTDANGRDYLNYITSRNNLRKKVENLRKK